MKPSGEVVKPPFEIDHAVEKLDSLVSLINSFDEEARVVLEDTGHYHLPVASYLSSHDIFVCCINALRMKKYVPKAFAMPRLIRLTLYALHPLASHTGLS